MGSRLFDEIREKRGLCYSVYALDHVFADVPGPAARLGPGLDEDGRGLHAACARSSTSCATTGRPRRRSSGPEPTPRGAWCWRSRTPDAVARHAANQAIVFGEEIDPDAAIAALDAVTFDEVREVAADRGRPRSRVRRAAHGGRVLGLVRAARGAGGQSGGGSPCELRCAGVSASFVTRGSSPTSSRIQPASPRRRRASAPRPSLRCRPSLSRTGEHRLEDRQRGAAEDRDRTSCPNAT